MRFEGRLAGLAVPRSETKPLGMFNAPLWIRGVYIFRHSERSTICPKGENALTVLPLGDTAGYGGRRRCTAHR